MLAAENGDYRAAVGQRRAAQAIFDPLGLTERMAFAATVLGSAHRYLGNNEGARAVLPAAMDLRTELGDRRGVSVAINNMALLELDDGNIGRARELFEQSLAIKREFGEQRAIAVGLANLADVLIRTGQWDAAERVLAEGAGLATGIPQIVGTIRCNQGELAAHREDWAAAAGHFQAAITASQAGGHPHDAVEAMIGLARVWYHDRPPGRGRAQLLAARALAAELGSPQRVADADAALAELAGDAGPALAAAAGAGPAGARTDSLTARQAEVLGLVAAGRQQQADRGRARPQPGDGRAPPGHHLPQPRPGRPGGRRQVRDRARADRAAHVIAPPFRHRPHSYMVTVIRAMPPTD